MTTHPILRFADFDKTFHLYIDARDHAIGASLMEPDDQGIDLLVLHYSKKFTAQKIEYCTPEHEAYALLLARSIQDLSYEAICGIR